MRYINNYYCLSENSLPYENILDMMVSLFHHFSPNCAPYGEPNQTRQNRYYHKWMIGLMIAFPKMYIWIFVRMKKLNGRWRLSWMVWWRMKVPFRRKDWWRMRGWRLMRWRKYYWRSKMNWIKVMNILEVTILVPNEM